MAILCVCGIAVFIVIAVFNCIGLETDEGNPAG